MAKMGYRAAVAWLVDNDDASWLDEEPLLPSVSASLVADIFGKSTDDVIKAMNTYRAKGRR